eukprot:CAMPEP_0206398556 /NCGR_PEP_ID=MMETSP0294-20121207/24238_1 /ASSEMBLY_ACC=CAM_ASM_000327 /TAXON_ID=39354 /ORGANISM="Heterosigma akashiwo, Strain CCMP2393" /LENGTH=171 /DNA_ID=CAMNT_0053854075 /DNA_START=129 /DNA_END=644 /DNA_ORIENTATION=-
MVPHEGSHSQPQHEDPIGCDFFGALLDSFSPGDSPTPGSPQSHQHLHMLGLRLGLGLGKVQVRHAVNAGGGSPYAGPAPGQGGWGMPQVAPGAPAGIHSMPHLDLTQTQPQSQPKQAGPSSRKRARSEALVAPSAAAVPAAAAPAAAAAASETAHGQQLVCADPNLIPLFE